MEKLDRSIRRGKISAGSEHIPDVFAHGPQTEMSTYLNERKESIYVSNKKEPLGRSQQRGTLPDSLNNKTTCFGVRGKRGVSAKELMYPTSVADPVGTHEQYIKSHKAYKPGEQRNRAYEWENTTIKDPVSHRFGKVVKDGLQEGVMLSLNAFRDTDQPPKRIVPKAYDDFKNVTSDELGKCKNLGQANASLERHGMTFGVTTLPRPEEGGAAECIRGQYSSDEQAPDADLGRSLVPGLRNMTRETRAFGVPTIRSDISPPVARSIADCQNYGTDTTAKDLLHPTAFASVGVNETDFTTPLPRAEIKDLFESIGYRLDSKQFQDIWATASHFTGTPDLLSVATFRKFLNMYMDALKFSRR